MREGILTLFLLCLLPTTQTAGGGKCSWNNCNEWSKDPNVINVHLIPHTHDDLGWIKTVDQYYFGTKQNLVPVGVQYIYNTVIDELLKDPTRRFSFAEAGFLTRWTSTHGDFDKHRLQGLVSNGQIELIGGGWVQNDEAASHYVDIIDQMELGLRKLDILFGECGLAQTAWQIDPFGHSREVANLFAMMGYSSLFFARVHYLEKAARLRNKSLEFVWDASDDLKTNILTGAFFQDNYGPPPGFCFDAFCEDDAIVEQEDMEGYNAEDKVAKFAAHVKNQSSFQRTKHVMLLMGSDFQYSNADMWYTNLDKLIRLVNGQPSLNIRVFYSTPTCYVKALNEVAPRLTSKNDDFFPYASDSHAFWTGYFTSRPAFKGMIRDASALLQLANQLDVNAHLGPEDDADVEKMKKASALVQHHDAVTGTAKENVTRDYEKRLAEAMAEGEVVINDALRQLAAGGGSTLPRHFLCPLTNETVCVASNTSAFALTVFNPRGQVMQEIIRVPFYARAAAVTDANGTAIVSQLVKTVQNAVSSDGEAPFELLLPLTIPPLGFTTVFVKNASNLTGTRTRPLIRARSADSNDTIENDLIRVHFDATGLVSAIENKQTNISYPFKQQFFFYEGIGGPHSAQPSGAYIFRPKETSPTSLGDQAKLDFTKGPIIEEARQTFSPWVSQVISVKKGSRDVEFRWTVGPIPKEEKAKNRTTKEVITRYTTNLKSAGTFYTDANGRQLMKRTRNSNPSFTYVNTEPVSANYYPVTSSVLIRDGTTQLSVLTDRSQGATSGADGVVELMLHRRCFYDDHFGVEEALDEPGKDGRGLIVTGSHVVQIGPQKEAAARHRKGQHDIFHKPILAVAPFTGNETAQSYVKQYKTEFSGLTRPLPDHAHLVTLAKWKGKQVILRLEHLFQSNEDVNAAEPITIDLKDLFTTLKTKSKTEVMLAGFRQPPFKRPDEGDDLVVKLHPMDIRTYILDVEDNRTFRTDRRLRSKGRRL